MRTIPLRPQPDLDPDQTATSTPIIFSDSLMITHIFCARQFQGRKQNLSREYFDTVSERRTVSTSFTNSRELIKNFAKIRVNSRQNDLALMFE